MGIYVEHEERLELKVGIGLVENMAVVIILRRCIGSITEHVGSSAATDVCR